MGIPYSVFTMVDLNYGWMMQSFGLVRMQLDHKPVYLRPKFYAVQHVTSLLTPDIVPDNEVTVESACGRKIACVGLKKGEETVGCALWFCDDIPSGDLEWQTVNVKISGITAPKHVTYVDMLSGKMHSLPCLKYKGSVDPDGTLSISSMPLSDWPVVIINSAAL